MAAIWFARFGFFRLIYQWIEKENYLNSFIQIDQKMRDKSKVGTACLALEQRHQEPWLGNQSTSLYAQTINNAQVRSNYNFVASSSLLQS